MDLNQLSLLYGIWIYCSSPPASEQEITLYSGFPLPNDLFAGVAKSNTTSLTSWLLDSFGMCGAKVLPGELDNTHIEEWVHFYDNDNTFHEAERHQWDTRIII